MDEKRKTPPPELPPSLGAQRLNQLLDAHAASPGGRAGIGFVEALEKALKRKATHARAKAFIAARRGPDQA